MKIGGLQKLTLIDYPGRLACTVFLSGCSFRCAWCYSPELVLPEKIKEHPEISQKHFFNFLEERKGLLEGVVICGGEPTINKELLGFIKKIKDLGYLVKLDTNGSQPEMLKRLLDEKLIDYIAMDIKATLGPNYGRVVGVDVEINEIKQSIEMIKDSGIDFEFRTTVVPGIHTKQDIINIAKYLHSTHCNIECKYYLQNFKPEKTLDPKFEKIKPYPDEWLEDVKAQISKFFKNCEIR